MPEKKMLKKTQLYPSFAYVLNLELQKWKCFWSSKFQIFSCDIPYYGSPKILPLTIGQGQKISKISDALTGINKEAFILKFRYCENSLLHFLVNSPMIYKRFVTGQMKNVDFELFADCFMSRQ